MTTWFVTGGSGFVGRTLLRALQRDGIAVRALARSPDAQRIVAELGAEPVVGDLNATAAMTAAMRGCSVVVHAAAEVSEWGPRQRYYDINVQGTRNVLEAARQAGVPRLVHVGTEAPFATGQPIVDLDETEPLPRRMLPRYPQTKGEAERLVREASGKGLDTVVVRPRMIWGPDDTSLLPQIIAAARAGRLRWINGGHHLTSTCHVANVAHGIRLAAERGRSGAVYFLTDGEPVPVREFLSALLRSQGVTPPKGELQFGVAWAVAGACEGLWNLLRLQRPPPVTRVAVALIGVQVTVSDALARRELGYAPVITREQGLAELASAAPTVAAPA